jgi:hypothetical protein
MIDITLDINKILKKLSIEESIHTYIINNNKEVISMKIDLMELYPNIPESKIDINLSTMLDLSVIMDMHNGVITEACCEHIYEIRKKIIYLRHNDQDVLDYAQLNFGV